MSTEMKVKFTDAIRTPMYQNLMVSTLQDPKRKERFQGAIMSYVAATPALQECDPMSIVTSALTGEMLGLSPSPQLGQFYLIPRGGKACFQLGYRGLTTLAVRSGLYKKINVAPIKAGELKSWNPVTEELELNIIQDGKAREEAETIGYMAYFEMTNGFQKTVYWSKAQVESHHKRFSRNSDIWKANPDAMAMKTVLTNLLSKWGTLTVDTPIMTAIEADLENEEPDVEEPVVVEVQAEPVEASVPPASESAGDISFDDVF